MGHFVTDEVDRIRIDKEHWVDIKRRMSYGDSERLLDSFVRVQTLPTAKSAEDVDVEIKMGNVTLLLINIVSWNLQDESGKVPPVTEDNIRQLDNAIAAKLKREILKRNQPPKA